MRFLGPVLACLVAAGCAGGQDRPPVDGAAEGAPILCAPPGKSPPGYVLVDRQEIRFPDRVALRLEFRDRGGRGLYYLLGMAGGVGEGLPLRGTPVLAGGAPGRFLGSEDRWAVAWRGSEPCEDMAIVGNDLSRQRFRAALASIGLWDRCGEAVGRCPGGA